MENTLSSLINELKVNVGWDLEANELAGWLFHRKMAEKCTTNVNHYLSVFGEMLRDDVKSCFKALSDSLDLLISEFMKSEDYKTLMTRGLLSAVRFYDTYVLRQGETLESVPHLFLRLSVFFTCECYLRPELETTLKSIQETKYHVILKCPFDFIKYFFTFLSKQLVCCATPVVRSAGLKEGHLSSCFIISPNFNDEYNTRKALCEQLLPLLHVKSGVGVNMSSFSQLGKNIQTCIKMINGCVEYYNEANVRPVSVALYLEVWHYQILEFLNAKKPENPDRSASIFLGVCIPDIFFQKYEKDPTGDWYLFDPKDHNELQTLYGDQFTAKYEQLVAQRLYVNKIPLKTIVFSIIDSIIKTGSPYLLFKDPINKYYWHETQGMAINCANLCAEVIQRPGMDVAVCNLANICLPACLKREPKATSDPLLEYTTLFSHETLVSAVRAAVIMINAAILGGFNPTDSVARGQGPRSMGLGVQGLADVFAELNLNYLSPQSEELDAHIFELMYYHAVETSNEIVKFGHGEKFSGWTISKLSEGILHPSHWQITHRTFYSQKMWTHLSQQVKEYGTFNSQFIALMPTAGTSQLTGYSDSFYPFFANMSSKVSNKEEIIKPNITFLKHVRREDLPVIKFYGGDVSKFPDDLKQRYSIFKTAFDMCPFEQLKRARLRAPFVDQSQSFSYFLKEENVTNASYLRDLIFFARKLGLKTLMYYCRVQKQSISPVFQCLSLPEKPIIKREGKATDTSEQPINKRQCTQGSPDAQECLACQ